MSIVRDASVPVWISILASAAACQNTPQVPPCGDPGTDCPPPNRGTFVDPLVHVGRAEGPSFVETLDVVADGSTIYACSGTQGMLVWDAAGDGPPALLSVRTAPTQSGLAHARFPRCQHVGLDRSAQRVAITNRGDEIQPTPWLAVYDVSDPGQPDLASVWTPPGAAPAPIEGVSFDEGRIYVAAHTSGVVALQPDDTGALREIGAFADAQSDAWQPLRVGDTLLVAEGATGLRTYDVSGDVPVLLATLSIAGSSRDIIVQGDLAYLAASSALAVVDVSDPSAPQLVSETPTPGTSLALAMGAFDTVVVAEWDQLRGYSVVDPAQPWQVFAEVPPSDDNFARVLGLDTDRDRGRVYAAEWRGTQVFEQQENANGPDVLASPGALQFGAVKPGTPQSQVLVVRNSGDRPLTVTDIVGGGGAVADDRCFVIEPGSARAVEVTLDPSSTDELRSQVKICSDDLDEPEFSVGLTANIAGRGVGDPAPEFALRTLDGTTWSNEGIRGKVAVLAYFATF